MTTQTATDIWLPGEEIANYPKEFSAAGSIHVHSVEIVVGNKAGVIRQIEKWYFFSTTTVSDLRSPISPERIGQKRAIRPQARHTNHNYLHILAFQKAQQFL